MDMDNLRIETINLNTEDAGIVRTSTQRQQDDGDSPEIQKEKIRYAANKQYKDVGIWVNIAMPASGIFETQPLLKALPHLANIPSLKRVWIAIVNRATRGELFDFLMVQREYALKGLELCDPQGELSPENRDTLESFDVTYKFNKYDANEGKRVDAIMSSRKNWRDTLTQLHSAEIKAARMGYWVSGATPFGYKKVRRQTEHGKRLFLEPDNDKAESLWVRTMFDLALKKQPKSIIVREVNKLGYHSKTRQKHNKYNKVIIEGQLGDMQLVEKQLDVYLQNPIYALIRDSKSQQTGGVPIKIFGTPFISIDQFNEINEGRIRIIVSKGEVKIIRGKPLERYLKNAKPDEYPFKRFVLCPICKSYLYAGAPKNGSGKPSPRYHCQKGHKHWSVNTATFDKTILEFTQNLKLKDDKILQFKEIMLGRLQNKLVNMQGTTINHQIRVTAFETLCQEIMMKIRATKNLEIQAALEEDYEKATTEKLAAIAERDNSEKQQVDIEMVINRVMYFLNHLEKGLLGLSDGLQRAAAWSTIFAETPTYNDLVFRTAKLRSHVELISTSATPQSLNVGTEGLEPPTSSV
jgi:hypothetical protein